MNKNCLSTGRLFNLMNSVSERYLGFVAFAYSHHKTVVTPFFIFKNASKEIEDCPQFSSLEGEDSPSNDQRFGWLFPPTFDLANEVLPLGLRIDKFGNHIQVFGTHVGVVSGWLKTILKYSGTPKPRYFRDGDKIVITDAEKQVSGCIMVRIFHKGDLEGVAK